MIWWPGGLQWGHGQGIVLRRYPGPQTVLPGTLHCFQLISSLWIWRNQLLIRWSLCRKCLFSQQGWPWASCRWHFIPLSCFNLTPLSLTFCTVPNNAQCEHKKQHLLFLLGTFHDSGIALHFKIWPKPLLFLFSHKGVAGHFCFSLFPFSFVSKWWCSK